MGECVRVLVSAGEWMLGRVAFHDFVRKWRFGIPGRNQIVQYLINKSIKTTKLLHFPTNPINELYFNWLRSSAFRSRRASHSIDSSARPGSLPLLTLIY